MRAWILRGVLGALACAAVAYPLTRYQLSLDNTLHSNGRWESVKGLLERPPMNPEVHQITRQMFAGDRLDLSVWAGFNQLYHVTPVRPREISCEVFLVSGAHVCVLFGYSEGKGRALRLSAQPLHPGALLEYLESGEFVGRERVAAADVEPNRWHRVRLAFDAGQVRCFVNDAPIGAYPVAEVAGQFGFRGGEAAALVDNVRVLAADGRLITEDFRRTEGFAAVLAITLAAVAGGAAVVFLLIWAATRSRESAASWTLALVFNLAVVCFIWAAFDQRIMSLLYPPEPENVERVEEDWVKEHQRAVSVDMIRQIAGAAKPDHARVLVLGASQVYGAGVTRVGEGMVERLGERLNRPEAGLGRVRVINGGVPGAWFELIVRYYERDWSRVQPDLIVINAGMTDRNPKKLAMGMRRLLTLIEERRVPALVSLEASTRADAGDWEEKRELISGIAAEFGVPVFDTYACVDEHADSGFLWWDLAHPTSYGHALIAECLAPPVEEALRGLPQYARGDD